MMHLRLRTGLHVDVALIRREYLVRILIATCDIPFGSDIEVGALQMCLGQQAANGR